jgi:hypothetical protein
MVQTVKCLLAKVDANRVATDARSDTNKKRLEAEMMAVQEENANLNKTMDGQEHLKEGIKASKFN